MRLGTSGTTAGFHSRIGMILCHGKQTSGDSFSSFEPAAFILLLPLSDIQTAHKIKEHIDYATKLLRNSEEATTDVQKRYNGIIVLLFYIGHN